MFLALQLQNNFYPWLIFFIVKTQRFFITKSLKFRLEPNKNTFLVNQKKEDIFCDPLWGIPLPLNILSLRDRIFNYKKTAYKRENDFLKTQGYILRKKCNIFMMGLYYLRNIYCTACFQNISVLNSYPFWPFWSYWHFPDFVNIFLSLSVLLQK